MSVDEDQLGESRPRDGDRNGQALCDIGALKRKRFERMFWWFF